MRIYKTAFIILVALAGIISIYIYNPPTEIILIALIGFMIAYGLYLSYFVLNYAVFQYRSILNFIFEKINGLLFKKEVVKQGHEITLMKFLFMFIELISYLLLVPLRIIKWFFNGILSLLKNTEIKINRRKAIVKLQESEKKLKIKKLNKLKEEKKK
ncbi:MAG: hypothetical protein WC471_00655 [Candidatus Woesearchaeota archaeon]